MRILMTGGTGLVGQGVLVETLADARVAKVGVLGRRALAHADARVEDIVVAGFDHLRRCWTGWPRGMPASTAPAHRPWARRKPATCTSRAS